MTSEVSVSVGQQRSLLSAINSLEQLISSGIQSDQALTQGLTGAAKSLADASDASRVASEAVRSIVALFWELNASQARVDHTAQATTDVMDSIQVAAATISTSGRGEQ